MKRIFFFAVLSLLANTFLSAQTSTKAVNTALLLVDIQEFYFPSGENKGLVGAEEASLVGKKILDEFRKNNKLIIHVQHKAKNGFDIHKNVTPLPNEKVFVKEEVSCFNGTGLLKYLQSKEVKRLIIIGMQTHMCLEAATRAAYDLGFECIVIDDACATRNLDYNGKTIKAEDVHNSTLSTLSGGGYAKVISSKNFVQNIDKYLNSVKY